MLCGVALKNHANGAHNPLAQFQRAIKRETYFASKFVATPLRLYDCAPITDGAAASCLPAKKPTCVYPALDKERDPLSLQDREVFTSFPATRIAAARAYRMADVSAAKTSISPRCTTLSRPLRSSVPRIWDFFRRAKAATRFSTAKPRSRDAAGQSLRRLESAWSPGRRQRPGAGRRSRQNAYVAKLASKREFQRGLAQSTGGLGTNNFVTILQRTDAPAVQNLWAPGGSANGRQSQSILLRRRCSKPTKA